MRNEQLAPVDQHLPPGEILGCILVISDYRLLNLGHASALRRAGYAVYTAVTCTDVPRVFETFAVDHIDLIAFASLVHGWHHQEAEQRPSEIPEDTDGQWHTRNILNVVEIVNSRQQSPAKVLVATDLLEHDCYEITAGSLKAAGVQFESYSASNPTTIVGHLQRSGVAGSPARAGE